MIVFIFGSHGMAGHMIANYLKQKGKYNVLTSSRYASGANHYRLDVRSITEVEAVLADVKPDIIINCTGILNDDAEKNPGMAYEINGWFPHRLVMSANQQQAKVMQISTDCVFSGKRGNYSETERPDGTSVYAKSKQTGELGAGKHTTIRTSIIGPELKKDGIGLFRWFMRQDGQIDGFKNVLWNGVTTLELAKAIQAMIEQQVTGLYHLTAPTVISKYALLAKIQAIFHKDDVAIQPSETPVLNRTLLNTRNDFQYEVPDYDTMLMELRDWMNENES